MNIENQLKKISSKLYEKNFQEAFQLIKVLRVEYPKNIKLENLFKNNNYKYQKSMITSKEEINNLYKYNKKSVPSVIINKLLKVDPKNAYIFSYLGKIYGQNGDFNHARMFQEKAITLNPFETLFYLNLAKTYKYLGLFGLSNKFFEYYLFIFPDEKEILLLYARNMFSLTNFKKSFKLYDKIIDGDKDIRSIKYIKEYFHKLVNVNQTKKAKELLNFIIKLSDEKNKKIKKEILYLTGIFNLAQGDIVSAKHNFKSCIDIDIYDSASYASLAVVFERENKFKRAIDYLNKAIKIDKNNFRAFSNLGIIYSHLGDVKKAIPILKKSLELDRFNHEAKYILGQMQIYNKEFVEGWKNFQSRWFYHNYRHKRLKTSNKLATILENDKNYLLWSEQGIGDQIMYGSMFSELAKSSKKIIIKLDQRLTKIFKTETQNVSFIGRDVTVSDKQFELHLPFGDLGKLLRSDISSFNKTQFPYINFDQNVYEMVRKKITNKKLIVGISWTSHNNLLKEDKSVYLQNLMPILSMKNINFIDLEYKNSELEKNSIYDQIGVTINRIKEIDMFNDILGVSSIIKACDLVVTCSNVNAHLSGALHKKTFLLLPLGKGRLWNWSSINNHSLWYPSVKIFQQTDPGDWVGPVEKIREEILDCLNY